MESILAETAVLPAMKSVSRTVIISGSAQVSAQACLPADRPSTVHSCIVGAIVVESTKGLEYYCSAPR